MGSKRDIATYRFQKEDACFFDTNVWLNIYGPQGAPDDPVVRTYSTALSRILKAESNIHVDVLVLSEFANRYARLEFDIRNVDHLYWNFKAFRKSQDFIGVAQAIADALRRILKIAIPIESGFSHVNLLGLINQLETDPCDFNDLVITALCVSNNFLLVTHDSDFASENVSILTANPTLQRSSSQSAP